MCDHTVLATRTFYFTIFFMVSYKPTTVESTESAKLPPEYPLEFRQNYFWYIHVAKYLFDCQ